MSNSKISRLLLGIAALACIGIFVLKMCKGSSVYSSLVWIIAGLLLGVLALALRPAEERARAAVFSTGVVMVAALMALAFTAGRSSAPYKEASVPSADLRTVEPTVFETLSPTIAPTQKPTATPTSKPTQKPTAEPTDYLYGEGMYKVGKDILPGEYYLTVKTDPMQFALGMKQKGYIEITSDSSGSLSSIITNRHFEHSIYLTLYSGEYVSLQRCTMSNAIMSPYYMMYAAGIHFDLTGGMYKAGVDFPAGEYKIICDSDQASAYYEITKDSRHTISSIVSNGHITTSKYVTILAGQYLLLEGCHVDMP